MLDRLLPAWILVKQERIMRRMGSSSYSRTSRARRLMARLPRLFLTRFESLRKIP